MHHELKTHPSHYQRIEDGVKRFEIRYNDRHFQAGDSVTLREFDPRGGVLITGTDGFTELNQYTGRQQDFEITYVTDFEQKPGWVVFGLELPI